MTRSTDPRPPFWRRFWLPAVLSTLLPASITTAMDRTRTGPWSAAGSSAGNVGRGTPRYDVQTFVQRDFGFAADRVLVYSGGRVQSAQSQQRRGSKRRLGRRGEAAAVVRSADRRNQQCGSWKRVSVRAARPVLNRRAEAALPMFRSRGAKTALFGTIRGETK